MRTGAIALVFGTRPELVKLAPPAWELGASAGWIHTGQHPWADLGVIADDLRIGPPDRDATVAAARPCLLGASVAAVADALTELAPDVVVVQGDTNSTLAGALATAKLGPPLVHLEARLRAFDRRLPEEHNRIVVDHLADVLCAPTPLAATQLADEGIAATLATIVGELRDLPLPVLMPVHPRTSDRAHGAGIELGGGAIIVTAPLASPYGRGDARFLTVAAIERLIAQR